MKNLPIGNMIEYHGWQKKPPFMNQKFIQIMQWQGEAKCFELWTETYASVTS